MTINKKIAACFIVLSEIPFSSSISYGQSVLEEVIVTAQRREQSLQDVPITVQALSEESLKKFNVERISDIANQTPGVLLDQGAASLPTLSIRGFSSPSSDSVDSAVVTIIDGAFIPQNRIIGSPMYDMQRVEILKGPQGALFGKNAIGGVMQLLTADPTEEFSGYLQGEYGNYDYHRVEGAVSGALTSSVLGRFSFINSRRSGYLDNAQPVDGGGFDNEAYRLKLRWHATDNLTVDVKAEHIYYLDVGNRKQLEEVLNPGILSTTRFAGLTPRDLETKVDLKQSVGMGPIGTGGLIDLGNRGNPISQDLALAKVNYRFDSGHDLTSITSYNFNDGDRKTDATGTPVAGVPLDNYQKFRTLSQEFQLASPDDGRFSYITGLYLENTRYRVGNSAFVDFDATGGISQTFTNTLLAPYILQSPGDLPVASAGIGAMERMLIRDGRYTPDVNGPGRSQGYESESASVYFEGYYDFNEKWKGTLGLRYTRDKIDAFKNFTYQNTAGDLLSSNAWIADFMAEVAADPAVQQAAAVYPGGVPAGSLAPGFPITDVNDDFLTAVAETAGLTYSFVQLPGGRFKDEKSESAFTPSIKLQYYPSENSMLYWSLATGYKKGGFNLDALTLADVTNFDNETAVSGEFGGKLDLLSNRMRLNFSLFWTEFDDLQVSNITPLNTLAFENAASARSAGLDLTIDWQLNSYVTAMLGYTYLDTEYTEFDEAPCSIFDPNAALPGCSQDLEGEDLTHAPKHSALLGLIYQDRLLDTSWDITASTSLSYRDSFFVDVNHDFKTDETFRLGARVELSNEISGWSVAIAGDNLTDERDVIHREGTGIFGNAFSTAIITTPRMYWLEVRKNF